MWRSLLESPRCRWREPLPPRALESWEREWKVRLPDAYRQFLMEVGDGGRAFGHQVFSLREGCELADEEAQENDDEIREQVAADGGILTSGQWSPAVPFPIPADSADFSPSETATLVMYPAPGAIPLLDVGCGMTDVIVVSGPRAGEVWMLSRDGGGMYSRRAPDLVQYFALFAA